MKNPAIKPYQTITEISQLSTRTKNLLHSIGGLNGSIKHFEMFGDFLSLPNCGQKSNLELTTLIQHILSLGEERKEKSALTPDNIEVDNHVVDLYETEKMKLSVRCRNTLIRMEKKHFKLVGHDKIRSFISIVLLGERRFIDFANCGRKTQIELQVIFDQLSELAQKKKLEIVSNSENKVHDAQPLTYPTTYTDNRGTEQSHFITDGQSMRITLRGIEFVGHFYELYPIPEHLEKAKELFDLTENIYEGNEVDYSIGTNTPGYSLAVQIPIKIITLENTEEDAIIDFGVNPTKIDFIIQGKVFPSKSPNIEYGISEEYTSRCVTKSGIGGSGVREVVSSRGLKPHFLATEMPENKRVTQRNSEFLIGVH